MSRPIFNGWPFSIMDGAAVGRTLDGTRSFEKWDWRSKSWMPSTDPRSFWLDNIFRTSAKELSPAELADMGIPVPRPSLV